MIAGKNVHQCGTCTDCVSLEYRSIQQLVPEVLLGLSRWHVL